MIQPVLTPKELVVLRERAKKQSPLIHYITHPIVMNDCANVILGLGAKPIMAEHPLEVAEITREAKSLGVNLGNISDSRMLAIERAVKVADEKGIPWGIDLVGVGCSTLRKSFAMKLITDSRAAVIKGNMSEIKAISGLESHACGIDVGESDVVACSNYQEESKILRRLAKQTGAVVLATGKVDLISDESMTYAVHNGCQLLARLTGTGCMLTGMITTFLAVGTPLASSLLSATMMGIAGERASHARGNGSFKIELLDELYSMETSNLLNDMRYERVEDEANEI